MSDSLGSSIHDFWNWFKGNCTSFGEQFENRELLDQLDEKLASFGPVVWELGPGIRNPRNSALAISPAGDPELLPLTRKILSSAPACQGWEFYSAKPPKVWDRKFLIEDALGREVPVDASRWSYYLLQYPDGVFDVIIKAPEMCRLDGETRASAAAVLLDGELGEELRLTRVHDAEIVAAFEAGRKEIPIANLRDHFLQLVGSQ